MATTTDNIGLIKPAYNEALDIDDINDNSDVIDTQIQALKDVITNAKALLGQLGVDSNGDTLISAASARATLDAAQSESATGSLHDSEQAISDIVASTGSVKKSNGSYVPLQSQISTLRDSVVESVIGSRKTYQYVPDANDAVYLYTDKNGAGSSIFGRIPLLPKAIAVSPTQQSVVTINAVNVTAYGCAVEVNIRLSCGSGGTNNQTVEIASGMPVPLVLPSMETTVLNGTAINIGVSASGQIVVYITGPLNARYIHMVYIAKNPMV